jgi:methyl-accepting chemotaxis protein
MLALVTGRTTLRAVTLTIALFCSAASVGRAQNNTGTAPESGAPVFTVDARIALASLIALSDGYLQKLADSLQLLAATDAARSADWEKIKGPLGNVGKLNIPALNWFALPDGSYWSVQEGKASDTLADRAYFPHLLAGKTVIGDLVVSKATGKSVAIVAVPILREDGWVIGALGGSVYLEPLSERIKQEMDLGGNVIFFSFDAQPLVALNWDPALIFLEPLKLEDEIKNAFMQMLSKEQGVVTYTFRNRQRTVLYRKSPVTGWWYAFGSVQSP